MEKLALTAALRTFWRLEPRVLCEQDADAIVDSIQKRCEHRWATWEDEVLFETTRQGGLALHFGGPFCGKCGLEKEKEGVL